MTDEQQKGGGRGRPAKGPNNLRDAMRFITARHK